MITMDEMLVAVKRHFLIRFTWKKYHVKQENKDVDIGI